MPIFYTVNKNPLEEYLKSFEVPIISMNDLKTFVEEKDRLVEIDDPEIIGDIQWHTKKAL